MALIKIAANKRHLLGPNGDPFFILGVNYAGYFDRAWQIWPPHLFSPELISRDFQKARQSGFNMARLFITAPLLAEIAHDNFDKLDQTLSLAQDHNLHVLLTLTSTPTVELGRVSELDAKIVARYDGVPTILGYDLEDKPSFYHLAASIYPEGYLPSIQTPQLVEQYGARVNRSEIADWQRRRHIPAHLNPDMAFYYSNALSLFLEYEGAITSFVQQGRGTILDFMLSEEAKPWYELVTVLDSTVEAWLRVRLEPLKATGCEHLLTVGWDWLPFAMLPANRQLDFQTYHHYAPLSQHGFNTITAHLEGIRRAYPHHPVLLGEFGWSNQSSPETTTSHPISPHLTALYEGATYAYLRAQGFAGGCKWMLNDVDQDLANPQQANFGVFQTNAEPKPIRDLILRFSQDWAVPADQPGHFTLGHDLQSGIAYRFDLAGKIAVGGSVYQDETINWQGTQPGHCFIWIEDGVIIINASGDGRLSIAPWNLIPTWDRRREAALYRVYTDQNRTRQCAFSPGQNVTFDVRSGAQYLIATGDEAYPAAALSSQLIPKPGEHVLLLADASNYLQAAVKYLYRFAPDFTFEAEQVAGRWPYVTVVAPADQIPNELLDTIRGSGAILVERIAGATPEETQTLLDGMAARNQRFLTPAPPPQEEPPIEPPPPTNGHTETYIVRPGDTLGKIARLLYGEFQLWRLIFEANRDQLSDPNLIRVGMELRIPEHLSR
jgi:hypothetical protein